MGTLALVSDIMLIGGVAIGLAGLTWLLLTPDDSDDDDQPAITGMCAHDGCNVAARIAF